MGTRNVIIVSGISLFVLAGCQNTPPPAAPIPQVSVLPPKTEVGEITKKTAKEYTACVWSNAEKMRAGSADSRLVVDTAATSCKKGVRRLQLALIADKIDPVFARSYVDTIMENAKNEAMVLVLQGNAKDAKDRDAKLR